jgi:hypothetical protein
LLERPQGDSGDHQDAHEGNGDGHNSATDAPLFQPCHKLPPDTPRLRKGIGVFKK